MRHDTDIGGPEDRFPATHHSAVLAMRAGDAGQRRRAMDTLAALYWKPVYKHVRRKWNADNEEAKDLTQGFFVRALEKGLFDRYDPRRASFRTFLRTCLDSFVSNERTASRRLKRGGDQAVLSLDFNAAETELQRAGAGGALSDDAYFHREWVRSVFSLAVEALRRQCNSAGKQPHFRLFEEYDLRETEGTRLTYEELARRYGLPVTQVTNYLAFARREFRRIVLHTLRQAAGNEAEFREEARALLGIDAPTP